MQSDLDKYAIDPSIEIWRSLPDKRAHREFHGSHERERGAKEGLRWIFEPFLQEIEGRHAQAGEGRTVVKQTIP